MNLLIFKWRLFLFWVNFTICRICILSMYPLSRHAFKSFFIASSCGWWLQSAIYFMKLLVLESIYHEECFVFMFSIYLFKVTVFKYEKKAQTQNRRNLPLRVMNKIWISIKSNNKYILPWPSLNSKHFYVLIKNEMVSKIIVSSSIIPTVDVYLNQKYLVKLNMCKYM